MSFRLPGDPAITPEVLASHKVSPDEYQRIQELIGRAPSFTELGVFSVMWSEHCSYKSTRAHLGRLPTSGPRVIQGPGENAGVVDIGDGFAVVFKMESHNHPSFIEPYQGAATGVGGILRDVFTMGARPVASLNALRFGRLDHPKTPSLLRGVVAGIAGYGNSIGVPTVGGDTYFHSAYDGNNLVNAFTCGVVHRDRIFYGRASGVGNSILYVGARTGRDGIHGATMASDTFQAGGPSQRPTVQVGDPFMEKLLLEACLEIFRADLLIGVQDMGAAGLTSSSVEMASRSGSGVEIDLDKVPRRARGLTPYEILLSESQERMLMVAKPGKEARVQEICDKWGLDYAVIGRVTDSGKWVVRATPGYDPLSGHARVGASEVVCDLPVGPLTDDAPRYNRPQACDPNFMALRSANQAPAQKAAPTMNALLRELLAHPNLGSRAWIYRQFDHIVRGGTRVRPGADAAVVRVLCEEGGASIEKLLAFSVGCPSPICELDPKMGAAQAVVEVCRNIACVGAEPIGLTDCLNYGSPQMPHVMWQIAQGIDGIAAACNALEVPIVSGNVSLYNDTDGRPILPTPMMGVVGLIRDERDIPHAVWQAEGEHIVLLGPREAGPLGGSEVNLLYGITPDAAPPPLDLEHEVRLLRLLRRLLQEDRVLISVHDLSEGGLGVALAECATRVGGTVTLPASSEGALEQLFGQRPGRVLVSTRELAIVEARAREVGVSVWPIGMTAGRELVIHAGGAEQVRIPCEDMVALREGCLAPAVGAS